MDCLGGQSVIGLGCCDQQKARPRCGEPFSSRHPESASSARAFARPSLCRSAPREFIRSPVSENGELPHCSARAFGGSPSEGIGFPVLSEAIHNTAPPSVDFILHTHIPSANPAGASRLQSLRPVRRVAELGSLIWLFRLQHKKRVRSTLGKCGLFH